MCSLFGILNIQEDLSTLRDLALRQSRLMRHRGPDWSGIWSGSSAILAHERLSIVDVEHGAQPLVDETGRWILAVNGEIYNHREWFQRRRPQYSLQTQSDCEVIIPLLRDHDPRELDQLNGMFGFVWVDSHTGRFIVGRDHLGIIPLYYGHDRAGRMYVASELKALAGICETLQEFPPGHFYDSQRGQLTRYYSRAWEQAPSGHEGESDLVALRQAFESSVRSHLMTDVPYGALLSGGLDSSLVAAVVQQFAAGRVEDDGKSPAWWPRLHTFSIGLKQSPDLLAARTVAKHLGTAHHEFTFTVQEGLDALRDVVYHLETYDVTTIRASTPMYLMARKIRAMGIKMVLSGEGADEIFGGYLYFHKAPSPMAFHEETVRKLHRLHQFDCNRANKAMAAWGIEARVPFLDKPFLDVAMNLAAEDKMCSAGRMEKHVLRQAFAGLLPDDILWRQKEQFSDGVGYHWIDSLKAHADRTISDHMLETAVDRFPVNTPDTKEGYLYRSMFAEHFPHPDAVKCVPGGKSAACSTPEALAWDSRWAASADPSGRAIRDVHRGQGSA